VVQLAGEAACRVVPVAGQHAGGCVPDLAAQMWADAGQSATSLKWSCMRREAGGWILQIAPLCPPSCCTSWGASSCLPAVRALVFSSATNWWRGGYWLGLNNGGRPRCRGDNHLGKPKAEEPVGWRPRDQNDDRLTRPARHRGSAAPAPGQGSLR
jgi:hypothetical protein